MNLLKTYIRSGALVVSAFVVVGCSPTTSGVPQPASSSSVATSAVSSVFGTLKACDLVDKAMDGQGFSPSKPERAGGSNSCSSEKSGYGQAGLTLNEGVGIKDFPNLDPAKIFDGEVNGRPAAKITDGVRDHGDCMVAMAVGDKNRVFVNVALNTGSTDEACDFAMAVAKKVEPSLPKGN